MGHSRRKRDSVRLAAGATLLRGVLGGDDDAMGLRDARGFDDGPLGLDDGPLDSQTAGLELDAGNLELDAGAAEPDEGGEASLSGSTEGGATEGAWVGGGNEERRATRNSNSGTAASRCHDENPGRHT